MQVNMPHAEKTNFFLTSMGFKKQADDENYQPSDVFFSVGTHLILIYDPDGWTRNQIRIVFLQKDDRGKTFIETEHRLYQNEIDVLFEYVDYITYLKHPGGRCFAEKTIWFKHGLFFQYDSKDQIPRLVENHKRTFAMRVFNDENVISLIQSIGF